MELASDVRYKQRAVIELLVGHFYSSQPIAPI
jgi:hypothetical protein